MNEWKRVCITVIYTKNKLNFKFYFNYSRFLKLNALKLCTLLLFAVFCYIFDVKMNEGMNENVFVA